MGIKVDNQISRPGTFENNRLGGFEDPVTEKTLYSLSIPISAFLTIRIPASRNGGPESEDGLLKYARSESTNATGARIILWTQDLAYVDNANSVFWMRRRTMMFVEST